MFDTSLPHLAGRVALVAGASSGIGAAMAVMLARAGASVAIVGRRNKKLDVLASRISAAGSQGIAVPCDLSRPDGPESAHAACRAALGGVDILVNSAAAVMSAPVERIRRKDWDLEMALNVTSPFILTQAVLPYMRQRGYGRIINISSAVPLERIPGSGPYAVTKAALNKLSELTDDENREKGVRAVALALGWIHTRLSPDLDRYGVTTEDLLTPNHVAEFAAAWLSLDARIRLDPVIRVEPVSSRADTLRAVSQHVAELELAAGK